MPSFTRALALSMTVSLLAAAACASYPEPAPAGTTSAAGVDLSPPVGSWQLVAFADRDAAVGSDVTLVVQADGKLAGSGGCNGYFGRWSLGDGQSTLGPIGATRRLCEDDKVMEVEQRYFDLLSRVGGRRSSDRGLLLTAADGAPLLVFRARQNQP